MYKKAVAIVANMVLIMAVVQLQSGYCQPMETWLHADAGYFSEVSAPLHSRLPISTNGDGLAAGLALQYGNERSYHKTRVTYIRQIGPEMRPSGIEALAQRFIGLTIDYKYTHFYFRNIAGLNLHFGSGPYLFVHNQISDFQAGDSNTVTYNSLLYGGAINLVLCYNQSKVPATGSINVINGGFWGNEEVNRQNISHDAKSANGWLSAVHIRAAYRLHSYLQIYLRYRWTERLEYFSSQIQRRTGQDISLGVSFRLEDD